MIDMTMHSGAPAATMDRVLGGAESIDVPLLLAAISRDLDHIRTDVENVHATVDAVNDALTKADKALNDVYVSLTALRHVIGSADVS